MVFIVGMTIWILALVLMGACVALGHKLGAIRAAITFIGILISALLAAPLSGLIKPLLPHLGVHNPIWLWVLPPFIVFIILLGIFKAAGQFAHRKVFVYYKHYTSELQMGWWERINSRVGLCVGTLNGLAYLILISFLIYDFSYWTTQIAPSDTEKFPVRILNRMGNDLGGTNNFTGTGMIKVARAIDPMPLLYFKLADLAGLVYQNPQLDERLADYPPFLSLDERSDFHDLGHDADFRNAWQNHGRIGELLGNDHAKAIWLNKETADMVWNMVVTNLDDLQNYLQTGASAKYNDAILGHWHFNVVSTLAMLAQTKPNVSSADMKALRALWTPAYAQTELIAAADGQAFLKNLPHFKTAPNQPATFEATSYAGQWTGDGENYEFTFASGGETKSGKGKIGGVRLTAKLNGETMIFDR
ncbi:MAG TPA: hypothetical protein VE344_00740 [Methylomirabilota bacterium]|nr:hypothetical protein [Methylomirabilota bacterium]